ncbi:MAG TPA: MmcQ/YjbR family DNA-binding protein [Actinomycetota bacterium]|nr:MmcQ/YjbR family DNA-binding protein [Actinomycetota bacterium]
MELPEEEPLGRLKTMAEALPECAVVPFKQHAAFAVRKRTFAWFMVDHQGDGMTVLSLKVPPGENQAMVAAEPDRFVLPAYVASRGWVSIRLDVPNVDWDEVAELLTDSYRMYAPKSLVKQLPPPPQA